MKTTIKIGIVTATIVTSLWVLDSCKSLCCEEYKGLPNNLISEEQAVKMRQNYLTNIAPVIQNSKVNNYKASDFVWIDYNTLKQYVALLDEVNELNPEKVSGVRIYFAQHLSASEANALNMKTQYPGRETVFFAPTTEINDINNKMAETYKNLKHIPFSIAYQGSNPLKGDFVQIDALLSEFDSKMANPKINIKDKNKGPNLPNVPKKLETITGSTSLLMDNMSITPPPRE